MNVMNKHFKNFINLILIFLFCILIFNSDNVAAATTVTFPDGTRGYFTNKALGGKNLGSIFQACNGTPSSAASAGALNTYRTGQSPNYKYWNVNFRASDFQDNNNIDKDQSVMKSNFLDYLKGYATNEYDTTRINGINTWTYCTGPLNRNANVGGANFIMSVVLSTASNQRIDNYQQYNDSLYTNFAKFINNSNIKLAFERFSPAYNSASACWGDCSKSEVDYGIYSSNTSDDAIVIYIKDKDEKFVKLLAIKANCGNYLYDAYSNYKIESFNIEGSASVSPSLVDYGGSATWTFSAVVKSGTVPADINVAPSDSIDGGSASLGIIIPKGTNASIKKYSMTKLYTGLKRNYCKFGVFTYGSGSYIKNGSNYILVYSATGYQNLSTKSDCTTTVNSATLSAVSVVNKSTAYPGDAVDFNNYVNSDLNKDFGDGSYTYNVTVSKQPASAPNPTDATWVNSSTSNNDINNAKSASKTISITIPSDAPSGAKYCTKTEIIPSSVETLNLTLNPQQAESCVTVGQNNSATLKPNSSSTPSTAYTGDSVVLKNWVESSNVSGSGNYSYTVSSSKVNSPGSSTAPPDPTAASPGTWKDVTVPSQNISSLQSSVTSVTITIPSNAPSGAKYCRETNSISTTSANLILDISPTSSKSCVTVGQSVTLTASAASAENKFPDEELDFSRKLKISRPSINLSASNTDLYKFFITNAYKKTSEGVVSGKSWSAQSQSVTSDYSSDNVGDKPKFSSTDAPGTKYCRAIKFDNDPDDSTKLYFTPADGSEVEYCYTVSIPGTATLSASSSSSTAIAFPRDTPSILNRISVTNYAKNDSSGGKLNYTITTTPSSLDGFTFSATSGTWSPGSVDKNFTKDGSVDDQVKLKIGDYPTTGDTICRKITINPLIGVFSFKNNITNNQSESCITIGKYIRLELWNEDNGTAYKGDNVNFKDKIKINILAYGSTGDATKQPTIKYNTTGIYSRQNLTDSVSLNYDRSDTLYPPTSTDIENMYFSPDGRMPDTFTIPSDAAENTYYCRSVKISLQSYNPTTNPFKTYFTQTYDPGSTSVSREYCVKVLKSYTAWVGFENQSNSGYTGYTDQTLQNKAVLAAGGIIKGESPAGEGIPNIVYELSNDTNGDNLPAVTLGSWTKTDEQPFATENGAGALTFSNYTSQVKFNIPANVAGYLYKRKITASASDANQLLLTVYTTNNTSLYTVLGSVATLRAKGYATQIKYPGDSVILQNDVEKISSNGLGSYSYKITNPFDGTTRTITKTSLDGDTSTDSYVIPDNQTQGTYCRELTIDVATPNINPTISLNTTNGGTTPVPNGTSKSCVNVLPPLTWDIILTDPTSSRYSYSLGESIDWSYTASIYKPSGVNIPGISNISFTFEHTTTPAGLISSGTSGALGTFSNTATHLYSQTWTKSIAVSNANSGLGTYCTKIIVDYGNGSYTPSKILAYSQKSLISPTCAKVAVTPRVNIIGGDLTVGKSDSGSVPSPYIKTGLTSKKDDSGVVQTYGSWAEYAIFAKGDIFDIASGTKIKGGLSNVSCNNINPLTFSSDSSARKCGGGYSIKSYTKDYSPLFPTTSTLSNSGVNISALDGSYGSSLATLNITSSSTITNKSIIINAPNSTVNINSNININRDSSTTLSTIPQVVIIAKNIIINDSVSNIDAWLIAKGNNNDEGYISTCGDKSRQLDVSVCSVALTINGPVVAKKLYLLRTLAPQPLDVAEKITLKPENYLWLYNKSKSSNQYYTTYSRELPPRL